MNRRLTLIATAVLSSVFFLAGCSSYNNDMNMSSGQNSGTHSSMNDNNMSANQSMVQAMSNGKNIIETATGKGMENVTTLVTAIKAAGLVKALQGPGPFTVFAPTNAAFDKLPKGTLQMLLKPENKDLLRRILLYHVHKGNAIMSKDAKTMDISTMEGQPLHVYVRGAHSGIMINKATVIMANIDCSNGVIHWIDHVLVPKNLMKECKQRMMDMNNNAMMN